MDKIGMRDWERFHNFEVRFKERVLKRLTFKEGFAIFNGLYQFAYPFMEKNKFNLAKIQLLKKRHFIFNEVNESLKATVKGLS